LKNLIRSIGFLFLLTSSAAFAGVTGPWSGAHNAGLVANPLAGTASVSSVTGASGVSSQSTLSVATAVSTNQTVTVTLKDVSGATLAVPAVVRVYMCTDSAGATPSAAGANTSVTIGGGGTSMVVDTAKLDWIVDVGATGVFTMVFANAGGSTYTDRVALVLPNGEVKVSAALSTPGS
jgi:hypothetical protein